MATGPIRMLSMAPPVFFSGIHRDGYLGIAPAFGRRYGKQKAGFMIFPTWTLERPGVPEAITRRFDEHAALLPERGGGEDERCEQGGVSHDAKSKGWRSS